MILGRISIKKLFIFFVFLGAAIAVTLHLTSNDDSVNTINHGKNFRITYYNIDGINVQDNFSNYLSEATSFWEDKLNEDTILNLNVRALNLDSYTTLAYGSMDNSRDIRAGGNIVINLNAKASNWTDVLKHEIGHVMGIGIADKWRNSITSSGGKYFLSSSVFPETYQIYQNDYNGTEENIPLGDVAGHFDESVFTTELMTPFSNEGLRQPITDLTLSSLITLGWNIDMSKAEEKN
jgi:hypothetical protein